MERRLSYSVVKDMYSNFWHHEMSKKDMVLQFLRDPQQIGSYIEDLENDLFFCQHDGIDLTSYSKGVEELSNWVAMMTDTTTSHVDTPIQN